MVEGVGLGCRRSLRRQLGSRERATILPSPGGGGWREFLAFKKARFRETRNIAGEGLAGGGLRGDLDNFGEKAL